MRGCESYSASTVATHGKVCSDCVTLVSLSNLAKEEGQRITSPGRSAHLQPSECLRLIYSRLYWSSPTKARLRMRLFATRLAWIALRRSGSLITSCRGVGLRGEV